MAFEIMVTASVGLASYRHLYYMQVITADEYNFYYVRISEETAMHISKADNLSIAELNGEPNEIQ